MSSRVVSYFQEARDGVTQRTTAPAVFLIALAATLLCAILLFLSAREANQVALARQHSLLSAVLTKSERGVAHDQESATVWNEAVRKVRDRDFDWVDANLGVWMHSYFGHDEVVVTELDGRPVYAMKDGRRRPPTAAEAGLLRLARPLMAELRPRLANPDASRDGTVITPGAMDLAILSGHPAVISVKPITWERDYGTRGGRAEYLHVSAKYLDGEWLGQLGRQNQLQDLAFSQARPGSGYGFVPLVSRSGTRLGFLVWKAFEPGTLVAQRIAPAMALALVVIGLMVGYLWRRIHADALKLKASEAQAQHLAFRDMLTGLANRNLFEEQVARELSDARADGRGLAYLFIDLDGFKHINDTMGHPAGDALIQAVGERLAHCVGPADLVGRLAGDEFAVLQTDMAHPADVEALCARILESLATPFFIAGTRVDIGASIGIALGPGQAADPTELARKADIALYEAKAAGRGCARLFRPEMDASRRGRREIEEALRAALESGDQFELHYQPLCSARALRITGAEALLRWRHPEKGMIPPAQFVPIAEETGLIEPLGRWVFETALDDLSRMLGLTLAINVSAVQLRNPDFASDLLAMIDQRRIDARRIEIEITETSFIENAAACRPNLQQLRARGVSVGLDDFGTGYSSFSHLSEFDVDRIKIDRSFVSSIGAGDEGIPIVRTIVNLAKALGLAVTGEGVETEQQRAYLARVGCSTVQGYLISPAVPLPEFLRMAGQGSVAPEQRTMPYRAAVAGA